MHANEDKRLYEEALQKGDDGWGESGRVTACAGSAVGLVKEVQFAKSSIDELRQHISKVLLKASKVSSKLDRSCLGELKIISRTLYRDYLFDLAID